MKLRYVLEIQTRYVCDHFVLIVYAHQVRFSSSNAIHPSLYLLAADHDEPPVMYTAGLIVMVFSMCVPVRCPTNITNLNYQ